MQRAGERENANLVQQAREVNQNRKGMSDFKHRHGAELNKGEDVRSNKELVAAKKKKYLQKMRESGTKKGSKGTIQDKFTGGKKISEKARDKIIASSRPTRSKAI